MKRKNFSKKKIKDYIHLNPYEKYILFKKEDRSTQLLAINNLYQKPNLHPSLNLKTLYLLRFKLLANSLLEKLELINVVEYYNYIKFIEQKKVSEINLYKYIVNDFKLYKLIWPTIVFNQNFSLDNLKLNLLIQDLNFNINTFKIKIIKFKKYSLYGSILRNFENLLSPLIFKIPKKRTQYSSLSLNKLSKEDLLIKNEKKQQKLIFLRKFMLKKYKLFFSYFKGKGKKKRNYRCNLNSKFIYSTMFYENLLFKFSGILEHPYNLIDIKKYYNILKNLHLSIYEIKFQLYLAKTHNKNIHLYFFREDIKFTFLYPQNLDNNNLKPIQHNIDFHQIKNLEETLILNEVQISIEFSFKNTIDIIEMVLLKFEKFISYPFPKLIEMLYLGIENQEKFFTFYNLLIDDFNRVKFQFDLYTITFLTEFLEFLYYNATIAEFHSDLFYYPLHYLLNLPFFKNFRLFRHNYWNRFELFIVNNSLKFYEFMFHLDYFQKNLYKNFNYSILAKKLKLNFYSYEFRDKLSIYQNLSKAELNFYRNRVLKKVNGAILNKNFNVIIFMLTLYEKYKILEKYINRYIFNRKLYFKNKIKQKVLNKKMKHLFKDYNNKLIDFKDAYVCHFKIHKLRKMPKKSYVYTIYFLREYNFYKYKELKIYKKLIFYYILPSNKEILLNNISTFKDQATKIVFDTYKFRLNFYFLSFKIKKCLNVDSKSIEANVVKNFKEKLKKKILTFSNFFNIISKILVKSIKNLK